MRLLSTGRTARHPDVADAPRPRPALESLPAYRPGRSAADAQAAYGVADAIKLASNELPWGPVPSVASALQSSALTAQHYPDHRATALRADLAAHLGVDAERVAVGCGASGILSQLALAYVGTGDEVVRGEPSFEAYPIFTRMVGGVDVAVPAAGEHLDPEAMAAAVSPRTRLVIVANPNNPTGTVVSHDRLRRLADFLHDCAPDCLLVVDEAYHEFVTDPSARSAVDVAATRSNVVVVRTFSKAHGLAGLRVGYAIAHPAVVEALDKVLVPFSVGALGQAAATASLRARDEVDVRVAWVVAERERVAGALRARGWVLSPSQTNFIWLPVGPRAGDLGVALEREGVVTRSFAGIGVRVTVGASDDNDRFLAALSSAWPTPAAPTVACA